MVQKTLHINLRAEYFHQIAAGLKTEEYRLCTPYWSKRLEGRTYERVLLKNGYPRGADAERIIERAWHGVERKVISHPHFGLKPVQVFAIQLVSARN